MNRAFSRAAALGGLALACLTLPSAAQAATTICNSAQRANAVGATGCWYVVGNANSNSDGHRTLQGEAIGKLGAPTFVYDFGDKWDNSFLDGSDALLLGKTIEFGTDLYGETVIGLHFGNGVGTPWRPTNKSPSNAGGVTAFYLFNFAQPTSGITLKNANSLSNAHLYETQSAVPEPATWLMLLMGFFAMAGTLRISRLDKTGRLTPA